MAIIRDGDWKLFDYDFQSGRSVWMLEDGNKTVFRTDYPVHKMIEENKLAVKGSASGWKGDYHRIASVPLNLLYDENTGLEKAIQNGDDKHLSRWLNDSDNRAWRTKEGRV
jgi:hypothetical protein